ncbi:MAG: glycosyltransferase family 2 protein, partial [Ornithinimicrobium sp.]
MTSPSSRTLFPLHVAGELSDRQIVPFVDFALRTRSPLARDTIRHRALRGHAHHPRGAGDDADALQKGDIDLLWGSAWGRLTALWDSDEGRFESAAQIFEAVLRQHSVDSLPADGAACYAQILLRLGRDQTLHELLPALDLTDVDRWCLRTDLLNPWRRGLSLEATDAEQTRTWCAAFNEILDPGLSLVTVNDRPSPNFTGHPAHDAAFGSTPYQRLAAPSETLTASHSGGDLVTVVMSAFRPGPDLHMAVRSVLAQTWSDLELIIVDDCSGPGYQDFLHDVAAQDGRIKIVTAEANAGTYAARNLALSHARGRYVTFQDSDDWTHPQRIEAQLRPLLEDREVLASRSRTLRAYSDLTMTYVGYTPERLNASSLLFEREPVIAAIGVFDTTRKSADMEFPLRLKAVRPGSVRDLAHPTPLAITQLRADSLSRSDAVPGWTRWDRIHYRDAYQEWHERLRHGRSLVPLTLDGARGFPLPNPAWSLDRRKAVTSRTFDVVVVGDLRANHPRNVLGSSIVELASAAGLKVGVATRELPEPLSGRRPAFSRQVQRTVSEGRATLTHVDAPDTTRALLVTEPEVLCHLAARPTLSCEQLWIYVRAVDATSCSSFETEALRHFGISPRWIPSSRDMRDQLIQMWGPQRVHPDVVPLSVAPDLLRVSGSRHALSAPLVIGHHLPDRAAHWPSGRHVLQAYPTRLTTLGLIPDDEAFAALPV